MAQQTFTCIDSEQQEKVEWNDSVGNGSDQWRKIGLDFLLLFLLRLLKHLVVVIIVNVDDHDHQMKSYHSVFVFCFRYVWFQKSCLFCFVQSLWEIFFWNLISHIDKNHFKFHCWCSVEYIWLQLICCCFQCQSDHQNWSIDRSIDQSINEMILIQIIITIAATTNNNNKSCVWLQILSISFSLTTKKINLI